MTGDFVQRLYRLEAGHIAALQRIDSLEKRIATLETQQYAGAGGAGGGGSGVAYFGCTLSAALAHGANVTNQTVWKYTGGARSNVTTTGKVYNDAPNGADDIVSGKQVILNANDDGTWTVVTVPC